MNERYDDVAETLWVTCDLGEDDLIPNEEIQKWIDALKERYLPDGRPLRHVNYVFSDRGCAEYNHYPLKFAKIGTFLGTLQEPEPFDEMGSASFEAADDFGMPTNSADATVDIDGSDV